MSIPLCTGANLIGYPSGSAVTLPDALASIAGKYIRVYAYDPSDVGDPWKSFDPSAPSLVNDLTTLASGKGYWVQMTQPAFLRSTSRPVQPTLRSRQRARERAIPSLGRQRIGLITIQKGHYRCHSAS